MKQAIAAAISLMAMNAAAMPNSVAKKVMPWPPRAYRTPAQGGEPYPSMVTASPEEIAAWNSNVNTRQVLRHRARKGA